MAKIKIFEAKFESHYIKNNLELNILKCMVYIYQLGLSVYNLLVFFASFFNPKAKKWREGRSSVFTQMEKTLGEGEERVWFHFPSLGEFEQGRTVLESYKKEWPEKKIVVTFYSPSGYEVRKGYEHADYIFYLPSDSSGNAKRFIKLVQPKQVFLLSTIIGISTLKNCSSRESRFIWFQQFFDPIRCFLPSMEVFFAECFDL